MLRSNVLSSVETFVYKMYSVEPYVSISFLKCGQEAIQLTGVRTNVDLIIHDRNLFDPQHHRLQTIPADSSNVDLILYPLFFPRG